SSVHVGIEVSAPINYEPNDFTRMIHRELARKISGRSALITSPRRPQVGAIARIIGLAVAGSAFLAAFLIDRNDTDATNLDVANQSISAPEFVGVRLGWLGIVGIAGLGIVVGYLALRAWTLFQGRTRPTDQPRNPRQLGEQALTFLTWSTTVERASKTTVHSGDALEFEGENRMSRTERDLTHAESVQALRLFLETLVAMIEQDMNSRVRIVICIDELDKIS